jgi:hypothetical protein
VVSQLPIKDLDIPGASNWSRLRIVAWVFIACSVLVFVISLTQVGFTIDRRDPAGWSPSLLLLLIGWLGVFVGFPAWLANPALMLAWLLAFFRSARTAAFVCSLAAVVLALSFLLHKEILSDEAGNRSKITGYGAGYWLWVASTVLAAIGCALSAADASSQGKMSPGPRVQRTGCVRGSVFDDLQG